jgi:PAS domain S-box-containing protein
MLPEIPVTGYKREQTRYSSRLAARKLLVFLLVLFFSVTGIQVTGRDAVESRAINFRRLSLEDGLSQVSVKCMLQDSRGLLWIGTEDGLNRYDGYKFTVFRPEQGKPGSISDNRIFSIFEDGQGTIWVGTSHGLNRFDRDYETFTRYLKGSNGLSDDVITALCQDQAGIMWVGTDSGGLNRFDRKNERFETFRHDENDPVSLASDRINTLFVDRRGVLWVGTRDAGLDRFERFGEKFIHYPYIAGKEDGIAGADVRVISECREGNLWLGTSNGLSRWDRRKQRYYNYRANARRPDSPRYLSNNRVNSLLCSRSGDFFIGTDAGLDVLEPTVEQIRHYNHDPRLPFSLSSNNVSCIFEDLSGVIWVGTIGGGLNKYAPWIMKFQHFSPGTRYDGKSLSGKYVFTFYEDSRGNTWIGTNEGINLFNRKTNTFSAYRIEADNPRSLSNNFVFAIKEDSDGGMWIGTWGGGLNQFHPETETFTHYKADPDKPGSLSSNLVRVIHEDNEGYLWIGTIGGGLNKFDRKKKRFTHYKSEKENPKSLNCNSIFAIYEDENGRLWLGTDRGGINIFDPGTGNTIQYVMEPENLNSLSNNFVTSIHKSRTGLIWVGTYGGGLNKFDPSTGNFKHYRKKEGLPSDVINGFLEDEDGYLWLSTNNGLSKFDPVGESFRNYFRTDGLQENEFNQGAAFKSNRTGEMYFGGINGFNLFHPGEVIENNFIPKVLITDFKLFNRSVSETPDPSVPKSILETRRIDLMYKDHVFSFDFASLDFSIPLSNRYQYKMEGLDNDWRDLGTRRSVTFTGLNHGDYVFRVRGTNCDGLWNEEGAAIEVKILPPYYKTWWFRTLAILMTVLVVLALFMVRTRSIRKRNKQLERVNQELNRQIDERIKAEEKVLKSERRLRTFLDTTGEGFLEVDSKEIILDVNPEMCSILGRPREDVVGHGLVDYINPEELGKFLEQQQLRRDGQKGTYKLTLLRSDKERVHCMLNAAPLFGDKGKMKGSFALVADITDIVEAENQLTQTRNYLNSVFNSLSSMLITVNRDGTIAQWNTAAEKFFGTPANEAISEKVLTVIPFLEDYRDHMEEAFNKRRPVEVLRENVHIERNRNENGDSKDGDGIEKIYLNISLYPLVYSHGALEGVVIRLVDVTESVQKDRQLLQAQKMETVGNLAGGLAHDFNNVLGGIVGTTSLIKYLFKKQKEVDMERIKSSINIIEKGANRAVALVKQLLTISRRTEPLFAPVDLNNSLKHVMDICVNSFDKCINLKANYHPEPAMVWADATQIEQVMLNLCVNASHAMTIMRGVDENQGGTLIVTIKKMDKMRRYAAVGPEDTDKEYWTIKVEDTGVGIDSRLLPKIYDPFFTTKADSKGTGLGLAMVYNITQQHDGFIDVSSKLSKGTVFRVILPCLVAENGTGTVEIKRDGQLLRGEGLILLVDDEENLRKTTGEILENCGYDVITAADGKKGIELYEKKHKEISLVMMDMVMPNMSGKEAFIKIREFNPEAKVLLTSGFRQDPRVEEVIKRGVNGFLQKPFSMVELSKKLAKILRK